MILGNPTKVPVHFELFRTFASEVLALPFNHYENKLTKNIRPFRKCSQIY